MVRHSVGAIRIVPNSFGKGSEKSNLLFKQGQNSFREARIGQTFFRHDQDWSEFLWEREGKVKLSATVGRIGLNSFRKGWDKCKFPWKSVQLVIFDNWKEWDG